MSCSINFFFFSRQSWNSKIFPFKGDGFFGSLLELVITFEIYKKERKERKGERKKESGQNGQVDKRDKWTECTSGQNGQVDRMDKLQ